LRNNLPDIDKNILTSHCFLAGNRPKKLFIPFSSMIVQGLSEALSKGAGFTPARHCRPTTTGGGKSLP
jgi:hypothetical protein